MTSASGPVTFMMLYVITCKIRSYKRAACNNHGNVLVRLFKQKKDSVLQSLETKLLPSNSKTKPSQR